MGTVRKWPRAATSASSAGSSAGSSGVERGDGGDGVDFVAGELPRSDHAPIEDEGGMEPAATSVDAFGEAGIEGEIAATVAEQVGVEGGQQAEGWRGVLGWEVGAGEHPCAFVADANFGEVGGDALDALAGGGEGDARPRGEVVGGGGSVAGEVEAGEGGGWVVGAPVARGIDPLVEQDVGWLAVGAVGSASR